MYVFARCSEYPPGGQVCEGLLPGVQNTCLVVMFDVCVLPGVQSTYQVVLLVYVFARCSEYLPGVHV